MGSYVTPKLAFVALLILNALVWSQGLHSRVLHGHSLSSPAFSVFKRSLPGLQASGQYSRHIEGSRKVCGRLQCQHVPIFNSPQCEPLAVSVQDQCKVVKDTCPPSDTFLSVPYLQTYFCAGPTARPFVFLALLFWLGFLFSTLGISASDFFCPNLATIAQLLNLDEHVAGVTFLAFGNGSPDVFATFSALRTNSGSLAIGELLGAASFIVSCVVGSMCIIKPFRVNRGPFLRDATFFTISVTMLLLILLDGVIHAWEAALLVLLYFTYVLIVVVDNWWEHRREKKRLLEARMRSEYDEEGVQPYRDHEPYRDERERYY